MRLKPDVDIVLDILQAVVDAKPESVFARSLLHQYMERGGLSKKQLEGLYGKATKVRSIPVNKLATLEAIILRKHEKTRSERPVATPLYESQDEALEHLIFVLEKFPAHKRALFLKAKCDNNEPLSATESQEIKKFMELAKRK